MLIRRSIVAWSLIVVALMCAASETFAAIQMPVEPPPTNKYKQRSKIDSSGVQMCVKSTSQVFPGVIMLRMHFFMHIPKADRLHALVANFYT